MFSGEMRIDNTMRKNAAQCMRKFQLQNMLGIQSQYGSTALRFGATFHGMMEGFYGSVKELGWLQLERAMESAFKRGKEVWDIESFTYIYSDDFRTFENCANLFLAYIGHFVSDESMLEVISTESVFALELMRETEWEKQRYSKMPKVIFTGKIDLQMRLGGNFWILDFKTTAQNPGFISTRLNRNTAIIGYSYASERVLQEKPEGALVAIAQATARKSSSTGLYGKVTMDFARVPQIFTDADIEKWKHSFMSKCRDIYTCWEEAYFPAEFDHCYDYNKLCPYSRICETNMTIPLDPEQAYVLVDRIPGFIIKRWNVEEEAE